MPNHRLRVHHTAVLGLLLHSAFGVQGCLAITWLGAVGIDMTRTSDIEFRSFENSWAVAPQERHHLGLVKSVAVMPFVGDPAMAERWIAVLQHMTDLRVVSLSGATRQGHLNVNPDFSHRSADRGQIELAKRISAEFQVDCVLFGSVADHEAQRRLAGLKESSLRRLYLHLISAEGSLLWKTELPYTIVKGAKDLDEEMVTHALLTRVLAQANEVGLAELGAGHQQAASRFLRDGSDHQQTQLSPAVERP
ncbi:MAG: hypothetical protein AB1555_01825 [Nitrospirota bacterium]